MGIVRLKKFSYGQRKIWCVYSKKERKGKREGDDEDDDALLHEQASLCFNCLPVY